MITTSDVLELRANGFYNLKSLPKQFGYVCIDSRKAGPQELFFALKGENHDAHAYLADVFNKGCKLAVVNQSWYESAPEELRFKPLIVVEDTTLALGELARIHKRRLKTKTIVVGGSNGKTTTKELLYAVLSQKYVTLKTEGNFNNHIGVPLTLLRLKPEHKMAVIEIGCNHFDEIDYLCKVAEPDYGIITNVGKEHLEFFKTKSGVAKAEFEMLEWMEKYGKKCTFFANLDDPFIGKRAGKLKKVNVISYSHKQNANVRGAFKGYNPTFMPVIEVFPGSAKSFVSAVNTFGKHALFNGLAAATVGLTLKVPRQKIILALESFVSGSSKRMEVTEFNGIKVINDTYNSNPDSVQLGLETLKEFKTEAAKYVVLGDMLELGEVSKKEHEAIGKLMLKYKLPHMFTFGPDSKHTTAGAKGIKLNKHYKDKALLISDLKKRVKRGDIVYVKGSRGMKMEEVVNALMQT